MKSLVSTLHCLMLPFLLSLILGINSQVLGQNQPPSSAQPNNQYPSQEFQSIPDETNWKEIMNELEDLYMLFPPEEWDDEMMEEYPPHFRDFMQKRNPHISKNLVEARRHLEMAMHQLEKAIRQMPEFPHHGYMGYKLREHHLPDSHSYGFHHFHEGCPFGTFIDDSIIMDTTGKSVKIIRKIFVKDDTLTKEIQCIRRATPNGRIDTLIIFKNGERTGDSIVWNRIRQRANLHSSRQTAQSRRYSEMGPKSKTLNITDLNSEDLKKLSHSAMKPSQAKEPLGLDRLIIKRSGPDKIHIRFSTELSDDLEVLLFDEQGTLLHHEILKKFSGNYDRILTLTSQPVYYLKIQQGKKVLQKKISE